MDERQVYAVAALLAVMSAEDRQRAWELAHKDVWCGEDGCMRRREGRSFWCAGHRKRRYRLGTTRADVPLRGYRKALMPGHTP